MKVLLGVTGSVAAVLTPKLVRAIRLAGHEVEVVSTDRGLYFFEPSEVGVQVWRDKDEWPEGGYQKGDIIQHVDLGKWADVFLVAPLSADTLSDIANGKCDKFLTCIARAWPKTKPVIFAPAMNTNMWEHPLTFEHLDKIRGWFRLYVVYPVSKKLACGDFGRGGMAGIETIVEEINTLKI